MRASSPRWWNGWRLAPDLELGRESKGPFGAALSNREGHAEGGGGDRRILRAPAGYPAHFRMILNGFSKDPDLTRPVGHV